MNVGAPPTDDGQPVLSGWLSSFYNWVKSLDRHYKRLTDDNAFTDDIVTGSAKAMVFGDPATDGSWRIIRSGNNLLHQRLESGTWTTKDTITP